MIMSDSMGHEEMTIDLKWNTDLGRTDGNRKRSERNRFANRQIKATYPSEEELQKLDYRSKKELSGRVRIVEVPAPTAVPARNPR